MPGMVLVESAQEIDLGKLNVVESPQKDTTRCRSCWALSRLLQRLYAKYIGDGTPIMGGVASYVQA